MKNDTAVLAVASGGILAVGGVLVWYILSRPLPPTECVEGATQEVLCADGLGTLQPQACVGGVWVDDGSCYECVEGDQQVCPDSPSISTATCTRNEGDVVTVPHWVPTGLECPPPPPTNQPPTVDLRELSTNGLTLEVDAGMSEDPDGTIVDWLLDWGDGAQTSATDTGGAWGYYHVYSVAGTYNVTLTVYDNEGASASQTKAFTVSGGSVVEGILRVTQPSSAQYCVVEVVDGAGVTVGASAWGVDWIPYPVGAYTLKVSYGSGSVLNIPIEVLAGLTTTVSMNLVTATYTVLIG